VLRVSVGAVVLTAASSRAMAGVEAMGEALEEASAGAELTLDGEAGNITEPLDVRFHP